MFFIISKKDAYYYLKVKIACIKHLAVCHGYEPKACGESFTDFHIHVKQSHFFQLHYIFFDTYWFVHECSVHLCTQELSALLLCRHW